MIRLENVSLNFPGGITALHPLSLEFRAGQFTVLLGASGAGKSSLIRCLNLLQRPTTGCVLNKENHYARQTPGRYHPLGPP